MVSKKILLFFFIIVANLTVLSSKSVEQLGSKLYSQEIIFPKAGNLSYKVQKYLGLNFIIEKIGELVIKIIFKIKTRAKKIEVDLDIYNGFDLLRKKARSLKISAEKLYIKGIPLRNFQLVTKDPIFFKKKKVIFPLRFELKVDVNLSEINKVINNIPKWKKIFSKLELPIPPFGYTEIFISDLNIKVNEMGIVYVNAEVSSLVNPESEPIIVDLRGNLILQDKKLLVSNLKTEIDDIFTIDSDTGKEFSKFLADLINPVFDFRKIERNGLTIDDVSLLFGLNSLFLKLESRLLP